MEARPHAPESLLVRAWAKEQMDAIYLYPYAGPGGRHYLRQEGTKRDLLRLGITLAEGMILDFYDHDADNDGTRNDLHFRGTAHFDNDLGEWFVVIDQKSYVMKSNVASGELCSRSSDLNN